ncbi:hypothetical protein OB919_08475 [Halobacteria archaeon AArc-curdl1]|uniref:DUF8130 domain-containing protein n=1 Tax=Natronosalvus hydrolyticus TaxID=2979988 RepID=A0AAP2Z7E3_9EURY|nr:hypothetical protein [Halobacteria archaeon AArc-curdl1]
MKRRTLVTGAGGTLLGVLAGCLGDQIGEPEEGAGNGANGDDESDDDGGSELAYTLILEDSPLRKTNELCSLEVELLDPHIEADSPGVLEATLTNVHVESVFAQSGGPAPFGILQATPTDGDEEESTLTFWSDAYEESSVVGTDGKRVEGADSIAVSVELESRESLTRTYELYPSAPNLEAGDFEVTLGTTLSDDGTFDTSEYLAVDIPMTIEAGIESPDGESGTDDVDRDPISEVPRVDEPPYEIERPEPPDDPADEDAWNDHYLGESMPEEPSLPFEHLSSVPIDDRTLSRMEAENGQYAARLIENEAERDRVFDLEAMDRGSRDRLDRIDFDQSCLVVVESGFGSGSVNHVWRRVEAVPDGVHLHGYYTDPNLRTSDHTSRHSVVIVDRPDIDLELARVSLTVGTDRRVHFNSTEGPVSPE